MSGEDLQEIKPVGEFILQSDAKPIMTEIGAYYHYSDVCTLLRKFAEKEIESLKSENERLKNQTETRANVITQLRQDCEGEYLRRVATENAIREIYHIIQKTYETDRPIFTVEMSRIENKCEELGIELEVKG